MRKEVSCQVTTVAMVILFVGSAAASANDFHECLRRAHSTSVFVQRQFQRDLQRLVTKARPDLKDVAAVGVETQMAYFDVVEARFAYLLRVEPTRIETVIRPNGAAVVFDWSSKDTAAFVKTDPRYEALELRWFQLKIQAEKHPDRSQLLNFIQSSQEFRALSKRFVETHQSVKEILEHCREQ